MSFKPCLMVLALAASLGAYAAPNEHSVHRDGREAREHGQGRDNRDRRDHRDTRWYDAAHGHNHHYPGVGVVVPLPPRVAPPIVWGGVSYRFWDGVWLSSGPRGWISVRPPIGIVVTELPAFRSVVVIGGVSYLYANGVYYRERPDSGGYEVVAAPMPQADLPPPDKTFVYPRQGQSAQQQAGDEYECHRWAVAQSGFDPTGVATGQALTVSSTRRSDYQRARAACLEGRGYTVR